jgi:hypothetical protein
MEKEQVNQGDLLRAAENAVFLVEGWENLGENGDGNTRVYKGVVGPWVIVIRAPEKELRSESSHAEAQASNLKVNKVLKLTPNMARIALRRAMQDESERALRSVYKAPKRKRGFR